MPRLLENNPQREGISGILEASQQSGRIVVRKRFKEVYQVLADNNLQTEDHIMSTPGLPVIGNIKRGAICKSVQPEEINTAARLWQVTTNWDSEVELPESESSEFDPESLTPKWEWSAETEDMHIPLDQVTGNPIQNSAEEPLIVTAPMPIPVLTITRYELNPSTNLFIFFMSRTNNDPFWGAPADCALMADIRDTEATVGGQAVRQLSYVIKFRFLLEDPTNPNSDFIGWKSKLLDQGTRHLPSAAINPNPQKPQDYMPFLDQNKNPTTGNLDGFGFALGNADLVYLKFHRFPRANFNDLNLGPF